MWIILNLRVLRCWRIEASALCVDGVKVVMEGSSAFDKCLRSTAFWLQCALLFVFVVSKILILILSAV